MKQRYAYLREIPHIIAGGHANLGVYVLKNYATTDELQRKATAAAKKSLQLKILGQNALCRRFIKNWR